VLIFLLVYFFSDLSLILNVTTATIENCLITYSEWCFHLHCKFENLSMFQEYKKTIENDYNVDLYFLKLNVICILHPSHNISKNWSIKINVFGTNF